MSVLDMFNASVTHSFEHICSYLEMKPELVTAILQSIIKIELLNTTQGDLKDGDAVFALNEKFSKYFIDALFNIILDSVLAKRSEST